jgi:Cof subfamily protein (haloacid dehalogenase superfamily)
MKYRLVALDLDGTLLNSQLQIQRETIEALQRVREKGLQVMMVTGRHHVTTFPYWDQLQLDQPAVCCNGTYVYDFSARQALANTPLTKAQALEVVRISRRHDVHCVLLVENAMAYEAPASYMHRVMTWGSSLPERLRPAFLQVPSFEKLIAESDVIWKFASAADDAEVMKAFVKEVQEALGLSCEWSGTNRVDIAQTGNSKGARLKEWIAAQGIDASEVIAFGDHHNDIEMLKVAGMGVAMGNAEAEVQACANWITGSNDSSGIADALHRFVLDAA